MRYTLKEQLKREGAEKRRVIIEEVLVGISMVLFFAMWFLAMMVGF